MHPLGMEVYVMIAIALGNQMNASNGVSGRSQEKVVLGSFAKEWYGLAQILLIWLQFSWEDSTSRRHQPNVGKRLSLLKPRLWQGTGMESPPGWVKTKWSFSLPGALWVGSSEKPLFDLEL